MADNEITQWEYKLVDYDENALNKAGEQGWEGLSQPGVNQTKVLMKRPKVKQKQPDYGYER